MILLSFILVVVALAFSAYELYAAPSPKGLFRVALFLLCVAFMLWLLAGGSWPWTFPRR